MFSYGPICLTCKVLADVPPVSEGVTVLSHLTARPLPDVAPGGHADVNGPNKTLQIKCLQEENLLQGLEASVALQAVGQSFGSFHPHSVPTETEGTGGQRGSRPRHLHSAYTQSYEIFKLRTEVFHE